jgi:hypothetical protein
LARRRLAWRMLRNMGRRPSVRTICGRHRPTIRRRLRLEPNQSPSKFEPVSLRTGNSRRENVCRGQRRGGVFWRHQPAPGDRDRAIPRLRRQSREKSKTIPNAPGNRNCAGLGGGAGRTQTDHQAIMSPEVVINGRRRAFAPSFGRQDCGPIGMASPAQAPSRWYRAGRSHQ